MRLDLALVQKQLFETRSKAKEAIECGIVFYQGSPATKPSQQIQNLDDLEIRGQILPYVSRGGLKLEKALKVFHIDLNNKIVLDIGSSTGGFTDCALQHGAKQVISVEVGRDQMNHKLRLNPQVTLYEQTDFRDIEADKIVPCTIAVSDVSFISITKMLPKLKQMPNLTDVICLIKPQFECGKEIADKFRGIIRDQNVHVHVLEKVLHAFIECGFYPKNITFSPITGASGNIEYLAHFQLHPTKFQPDIQKIVTEAYQNMK
ncbi:MAG: TlyA family RNA methyltransferase [Alphaproteobacteria bacterium]|nr:TlyA family RNA methyltransferase [Alphaproteobacteria bacterium]